MIEAQQDELPMLEVDDETDLDDEIVDDEGEENLSEENE